MISVYMLCYPQLCGIGFLAQPAGHNLPCTTNLAQRPLHNLPCAAYLAQSTLRNVPCATYLAQPTLRSLPCKAVYLAHPFLHNPSLFVCATCLAQCTSFNLSCSTPLTPPPLHIARYPLHNLLACLWFSLRHPNGSIALLLTFHAFALSVATRY